MASAGRDKKKQQAKSKLSKPTSRKSIPYRLEIGSGVIKVIKVDAKGNVVSYGKSRYEANNVVWSDKMWINKLSDAVKLAMRDAKIPKGSGLACTVVTGGSGLVLQKFTWPELTHQAMLNNARHEISSYLPGALTDFVVGAEVQKKHEDSDGKTSGTEVFVAAMSKDMATAISSAVTWAGFKVLSLDVYENSRVRFISRFCTLDSGVPNSYGVLDLNSPAPHLTLYLNGLFYSTHYFTHTGNEAEAGQDVVYDADAILGEINFLVDFVKYQERSSNLECILVIGSTQEGLTERLSASLNIPVHGSDTWMNSSSFKAIKADRGKYADAYASALPSEVVGTQHMLDMKTPIIVKNPKRRLFLIAAGVLSVMFVVLAIGMIIPALNERSLNIDYRALDGRDAEVARYVADSPTDADIAQLRMDVQYYEIRLRGINAFYREFAQASAVVPILFGAEVLNIYRVDNSQGFTEIFNVDATEDEISVRASAIHYDHVAGLIEYFRSHVPEWEDRGHTLFRAVGTGLVMEENTMDFETGTSRYVLDMIMRRGMGER
jgi:hypothetical protein